MEQEYRERGRRLGAGRSRYARRDYSSPLAVLVDYVAVSALIVGAVLVNCGVMVLLNMLDDRVFGATAIAAGVLLLFISVYRLQGGAHAGTTVGAPTDRQSFRTPVVDGLTVRKGPGPEYSPATSIWQVNPGDRLRVTKDSLGWIRFHVKYFDPDWSGWVPKDRTTGWEIYQEIQRIRRVTDAPPMPRGR